MKREFGGCTYDPARDRERLRKQLGRVYDVLRDGLWHGLPELTKRAGGSVTGVSARVRDLRKPRYGGREIQARCFGRGNWKYRMCR